MKKCRKKPGGVLKVCFLLNSACFYFHGLCVCYGGPCFCYDNDIPSNPRQLQVLILPGLPLRNIGLPYPNPRVFAKLSPEETFFCLLQDVGWEHRTLFDASKWAEDGHGPCSAEGIKPWAINCLSLRIFRAWDWRAGVGVGGSQPSPLSDPTTTVQCYTPSVEIGPGQLVQKMKQMKHADGEQ